MLASLINIEETKIILFDYFVPAMCALLMTTTAQLERRKCIPNV
ncbi:MAG: hypothetical protein JWR68_595 [Polaromonas sp.]|nr:hypothetical protein [Polaromonas sp.]